MTSVRSGRRRLAASVALVTGLSAVVVLGPGSPAQAATQIDGVGTDLTDLATSPDGERLYALASRSNTLAIIDAESETIGSRVTVGIEPYSVASGETVHGERVYVADRRGPRQADGSITVVDAASTSVVTTIPVGSIAFDLDLTPDGSRLYVAATSAGALVEIDTATSAVVRTIPIGQPTLAVAVAPDGEHVYVTNEVDRRGLPTVSVVDVATGTVVDRFATALSDSPSRNQGAPRGIAFSPDGSRVFVADLWVEKVSVVDTATHEITATVPTGLFPMHLAITPDGRTVYVANQQQSSVTVIDTQTLEHRLQPAGGYPLPVVVSPTGDKVFVGNVLAGVVTVLGLPVVQTLSPAVGPLAGGAVTLSGVRLADATSVRIGDAEVPFTVVDGTTITTVAPAVAGPGLVDVVVTNGDGQSQVITYTYQAESSISASASEDVVLGGFVHDTAQVTGAGGPTGALAFTLHGPDDVGCSGEPVYTADVVMVEGAATAPPFPPEHAGTYRWKVSYAGDALHTPSSLGCGAPGQSVVVAPAPSTTTVTSSANPSVVGTDVTFTAAASSEVGEPTGSVTFTVDGTEVGTAPVVDGAASVTVGGLGVGDHAVVATYSGDGDHTASSASMTQTVGKIATTLTAEPLGQTLPDLVAHLAASGGAPVAGKQVTFTGQVLFFPVTLCSATTDSTGTARCSGGGLVGLLLGAFTATFAGDATHLPSTAQGRLA